MALYDNLFEPLQVGRLTIPNRIVRAPHGTRLSGEALIAYHEARAIGGVGMSTLEATSVHRNAPSNLPLYSDEIIPFYEQISTRMHAHGMKLFQQIYHPGASARPFSSALPVYGASEVPNYLVNIMPIAVTKMMIDDIVAAFAAAARRVRDGGLDGVDIHASSGYLIHEFLSPSINRRTDDYGGSFENRLRLLNEVIDAVRAEVGDDIVVGVRLPNEDYVPGSLDAADNSRIAQAVQDKVDYVSLHMGAYWRFHKLIAPSDDPLGVEMLSNKDITPAITKPRIVTGRIMTLDHASAIVRNGEGDLVSMVRALIADPELVNKARRLEEHRIRPCISTNQGCVGQLMSKGVLSCIVNVAAAAETRISFEPPANNAPQKTILVVGGGPAGMEAARTAAMRGHKVELHEAMQRLGGQVALAASAPYRADVGQITDWLASEIDILGVSVHLNSMVDAEMVAEIAPDEVILATGTMPRTDGFQVSRPDLPVPGHDLPHVTTVWDLFGVGTPPKIGSSAVIFDDIGTFEAISAADMLLKAGAKVTMVSRFEKLGEGVPFPPVTVGAARERLMNADFDFVGGHYLREITPGDVEIGVLFTDRSRRIAAETVVIVGFNQPNRELFETLAGTGRPVHMIGDALGRGDIMSAIHSAAAVAREI